MKMRLDRWLATLSLGSRSEVKEWIRGGKAAVNGRIIWDPALSFETEEDSLSLNGKDIDGRMMRHVMMYKPGGLLTAARDAKQPTVMDLLPPVYRSIGCMPVGRLDKDTTGLLLLTCDGELNHRLLSPGRHVTKRYRALVKGEMGEKEIEAFRSGLDLGDFTAQPAELKLLGPSLAETVITEVFVAQLGYNRGLSDCPQTPSVNDARAFRSPSRSFGFDKKKRKAENDQ